MYAFTTLCLLFPITSYLLWDPTVDSAQFSSNLLIFYTAIALLSYFLIGCLLTMKHDKLYKQVACLLSGIIVALCITTYWKVLSVDTILVLYVYVCIDTFGYLLHQIGLFAWLSYASVCLGMLYFMYSHKISFRDPRESIYLAHLGSLVYCALLENVRVALLD